jgi:hypothetical protein
MLVEALVAEAAVEALHEPVLLRLARRDVMPGHAVFLLPAQDRVRRQLGAVVTDHHCWIATQPGDLVQLTADPQAGERRVHHQAETLAGEVVHDRQYPQPTPAGEHVGNEVQRPTLVWSLRQRHWSTCAERPFPAASLAYAEPFLPVEPE